MRILIADDDGIARRILDRAVTQCEHTTYLASDGLMAWEMFKEEKPDAVISDWMMPGLEGIDLCRRIRDQKGQYIYFILLSALKGQEYVIEAMEAGVDDFLSKPIDRIELMVRLSVANRIQTLHKTLFTQQRELQRLNAELFDDGRRDGLTGLGNRRRMNEDLIRAQDALDRYGNLYSVAICDIDFFKKYNDACGHLMGDEALRAVGGVLVSSFRLSDSAYRYGGEEFLIVLAEQDAADGGTAMERVRRSIEEVGIAHPGLTPAGVVTASIGVAQAHRYESWESLVARADSALYNAKNTGRNRVSVFLREDEYMAVVPEPPPPEQSGPYPSSAAPG